MSWLRFVHTSSPEPITLTSLWKQPESDRVAGVRVNGLLNSFFFLSAWLVQLLRDAIQQEVINFSSSSTLSHPPSPCLTQDFFFCSEEEKLSCVGGTAMQQAERWDAEHLSLLPTVICTCRCRTDLHTGTKSRANTKQLEYNINNKKPLQTLCSNDTNSWNWVSSHPHDV